MSSSPAAISNLRGLSSMHTSATADGPSPEPPSLDVPTDTGRGVGRQRAMPARSHASTPPGMTRNSGWGAGRATAS